MKNLNLVLENTKKFVDASEFVNKAVKSLETLYNGSGKGNDFLGWLNLPEETGEVFLNEINESANVLRKNCEVVVVIGIGGSYLGAKAVIEAMSSSFACFSNDNNPKVIFAGQNLSEDYMFELTEFLKIKRFGLISISKSGTTTEPAMAFRILKKQLEDQQGKEVARELIVCITDRSKGALRTLATQEGYKTFVIEDNVGGRFSVLTPVGLLPVAVAGFDIKALIQGAKDMREQTSPAIPYEENIALQYAAVRNALYSKGKKIEILANYNPKLHYIAEWWKQLYGESEGKEHKGIFPVSVDFTSDLHSMGQWIQDGERSIFETVISIENTDNKVVVPMSDENLDGLNFIAGKRIDYINKMAEKGTTLAHVDGGVPLININIPHLNEYYLGQLLYFFEIACGISGYILDVNPFDQLGVEDYKRNMFALLEKKGYEKETEAILKRI